jgi:hypothetical protein
MYESGKLLIPDEDEDRLMYHRTKELLREAGYHRYEISNYAKAGYACRHNLGYWTRKNYVGFGIGAASLVENVRFKNGEDSLFMFLISDKFKKFAFVSKDAVYYRRYREGSAVTGKRSKKSIIMNGLRLLCATTKIWIRAPFEYNFPFYVKMSLAYLKGMVIYCLGKV